MWEYVDWPRWRFKNWNIKILYTSSENESKADDIKEEKAKVAKEELFDKIQEIKTKNFPLYSKETIQPSLRVWH